MKYFSEYKRGLIIPYEVIEMNEKTALLRRLKAIKKNETDNSISYDFESVESNEVVKITKRKNERWYRVGESMNGDLFVGFDDSPAYYKDEYRFM